MSGRPGMTPFVPPKLDLLGDRIFARPYSGTEGDEHFVAATSSAAELRPFMPWCHPAYSAEESEAWIRDRPKQWRRGAEFDFAIRTQGDEQLIGGCGLNHINYQDRVANLGYWVRSTHTGNGYATEVVRLLADFGLHTLGLCRLEIVVAVNNVGSLRVAEKTGATREGTLRKRIHLHGDNVDAVLFSLVG